MDLYKVFIHGIRKCIYSGDAYILLGDIKVSDLSRYVELLRNVKFMEGSYHCYYGQVKQILTSFMTYCTRCIDEVIKEEHKCREIKTKPELVVLIERSICLHQADLVDFGKEFLPVKGPEEQQMYDEIETMQNAVIKTLYNMQNLVENLDKQEKIDNFVAAQFKLPAARTSEIFDYTHTFLSNMLSGKFYEIRVSLDEIYKRLKQNLDRMKEESETSLNNLLLKLYDTNKENIYLQRSGKRVSTESAEITHRINLIRDKITKWEYETSHLRLENEVNYWARRKKDFAEIEDYIANLKIEYDEICEQERIYRKMKLGNSPTINKTCFANMGKNFPKRKEYLKNLMENSSKTIITFFVVLGFDNITYYDHIGPHNVDEFSHNIYNKDDGLRINHMDCEGNFVEVQNTDLYYYDKYGRYIIKDDEKIYQAAPCTSQYKIGDNDLMEKITKDCGHSTKHMRTCKMELKDPLNFEIVPDFKFMDIKGTLDPEKANYLWDNFGVILSDALFDVGEKQPNNPIHFLAHRLLYHKYSKTTSDFKNIIPEAQKYRFDIYQKRKEKAIKASLAIKSKRVKRRKESDDAYERAVFDAHVRKMNFITAINENTFY